MKLAYAVGVLALFIPDAPAAQVEAPSEPRFTFELNWEHAFRDDRNHDATWVVLRSASDGSPVTLAATGHAIVGEPAGELRVTADGGGVFVQLAEPYRGDVSWTVTLGLREGWTERPEVWAVEMVYVPAGPFELGDSDPRARELGSFHTADGEGGAAGVVRVASEAALEVGSDRGTLTYAASQYTGDGAGPVPREFPKGTRAFYAMKHELRQGEYARFLNALPPRWQARRRPDELPEDTEDRASGSIEFVDGRFRAAQPTRPCNFVTWDDTCAYLDFLGLRPLTEFEFEKAARGPSQPVALDYPWGTASSDEMRRRVTPLRDLTPSGIEGVARLDESNRAVIGASHYGVLDLAGSLWERVVSAGHAQGRAFRGTHGDGVLDPQSGDATNDDWPRGSRAASGIGFRGGAEYFGEPSLTNPFSAVGIRTFAAYDGAHRYKTYSARGARTAP